MKRREFCKGIALVPASGTLLSLWKMFPFSASGCGRRSEATTGLANFPGPVPEF